MLSVVVPLEAQPNNIQNNDIQNEDPQQIDAENDATERKREREKKREIETFKIISLLFWSIICKLKIISHTFESKRPN